jgi:hypothetical protein
MNEPVKDSTGKQQPGCNVSSTFNYAVGVVAIVAGSAILYAAYRFWIG